MPEAPSPQPIELRILSPGQEPALREWAQRHALNMRFRPLEDFLPGEGTGAIVAIACDAEARRRLARDFAAEFAAP